MTRKKSEAARQDSSSTPRVTREERRAELLDAATRIIRSGGTQVSMDSIAAEAGITKPILYRHFGDRAGLIAALGERFADNLLSELSASLDSGAAPQDLLEKTIDAYLRVVEADPEVYQFISQRIAAEDPEAAAAVGNFIRQVAAQVAVVLGEQLRAAGLDSGGAEPMAYGIVGMVHAAGDWWVERRSMPRHRLVSYLTSLLWGGISGLGPLGQRAADLDSPLRLVAKEKR